jgi:hypothetical protein
MSKYVTAPGRFRAYIEAPKTGGWLSETDNGSPFVRIPLVIADGEGDQGGREITWNGFLNTDKVIDRTTRMLVDALHVPDNWFELLSSGNPFLEGKAVLITVEQASRANDNGTRSLRYAKNGDPIYEVSWLNDPDKVRAVATLDQSKAASLIRKMRAVTTAVKAEAGGAAPAARQAAPTQQPARRVVKSTDPINDLEGDDIPF